MDRKLNETTFTSKYDLCNKSEFWKLADNNKS